MIPSVTAGLLMGFGAALVLGLVLTRVMIWAAPKLGLIDEPDGERRIHTEPMPRAGGLAVWGAFLVVMAGGLWLRIFPGGDYASWSWLAAFAAGSALLVLVGVVDDKRGVPALLKLAGHVGAACLFFWLFPVRIGVFPLDWWWGWDFLVFVGWAVVLINAFNLSDGLDGLCGGLAAVAMLGMGLLAAVNGRWDVALTLVVMLGAVLGFLRYNINPARIFLGDAGSMVLGFFVAAASQAVGRKTVMGLLLLPVAVAGVQLLDVLLAVWRREMPGWVGRWCRKAGRAGPGEEGECGWRRADKKHLHHRLLQKMGGSQRRVALVMQVAAGGLALLAFLPSLFGDRLAAVTVVALMVVGLVALRNFARPELEQTGNAVHLAIKLPQNRRLLAMGLFVYDVVVLGVAAVLAVVMECRGAREGFTIPGWPRFVVLFVVMGCLAGMVTQVHRVVWVRATLRTLSGLIFWLLMGTLLTFAVLWVGYAGGGWMWLQMSLTAFTLAGLGMCLPRLFPDVMRELGLLARHSTPPEPESPMGRVVILGAGDLGTLFVEHLKSSASDLYPGLRVMGFVDEQKETHGRLIRRFPVLGGLDKIPGLVESHRLRGIVLAIENPREELLEELERLGRELGLQLWKWEACLK